MHQHSLDCVVIQEAHGSFNGIVMLKVLPKPLVAFLMKTGLFRLFSCFKYTSVTLQETLDSLTDNQDLKAVLSYLFGDYGAFLCLPNQVHFQVPGAFPGPLCQRLPITWWSGDPSCSM